MMRMVWLLSLVVLACGCASTKQAQAAPRSEHAQALQVVTLKYAAAEELGRELAQTLGSSRKGGVRIVADPRTNSLILSGESEAELAGVLELISKLDVEAAKPR